MPAGLDANAIMQDPLGSMKSAVTGEPSKAQLQSSQSHVAGAAKEFTKNIDAIDYDPSAAANKFFFGGMAASVGLGLLTGCFLFRRVGATKDDDDDESEKSSNSS